MAEARVELIPFGTACGEAADLLNLAWPVPALRYTPAYLQWQADFPAVGGTGALAVAARIGRRMAGFAGATPRRMQLGSAVLPILVVSFVAVDPEYRGIGIAAALYAALIEAIRRSPALGILTFAEAQSKGLAVLEAAYRNAGLAGLDLGSYPTFARSAKSTGRGSPTLPPADPERPPAIVSLPGLLTECPDDDIWRHHLRDPRPSLAVRTEDGAATAIFAIGERRGRTSDEPFGLLTSLFVNRAGFNRIAELAEAAVSWIGSRAGVLVAPNLAPIPESAARGAAFRKLAGPTYVARLYPLGQGTSLLPGAARTTLTVT